MPLVETARSPEDRPDAQRPQPRPARRVRSGLRQRCPPLDPALEDAGLPERLYLPHEASTGPSARTPATTSPRGKLLMRRRGNHKSTACQRRGPRVGRPAYGARVRSGQVANWIAPPRQASTSSPSSSTTCISRRRRSPEKSQTHDHVAPLGADRSSSWRVRSDLRP